MTSGLDALAEAARLEASRVYSQPLRRDDTYHRLLADAEAAIQHAEEQAALIDALRSGLPASEIVERYAVDYATVRAARKRLMRGAA